MTYKDLPQDLQEAYDWLDEESKQVELEWDSQVLRFKTNPVIKYLYNAGKLDMNAIAINAMHNEWPLKYMMRFYRDLGCSLSGFGDIFHDERIEQGHF